MTAPRPTPAILANRPTPPPLTESLQTAVLQLLHQAPARTNGTPAVPDRFDETCHISYWNHRCAHCPTWVPNHLRNCAQHTPTEKKAR